MKIDLRNEPQESNRKESVWGESWTGTAFVMAHKGLWRQLLQLGLTSSDIGVVYRLVEDCRPDDSPIVSISEIQIAIETGLSLSTVRRAIKKLIDLGLLDILMKGSNLTHMSAMYTLAGLFQKLIKKEDPSDV